MVCLCLAHPFGSRCVAREFERFERDGPARVCSSVRGCRRKDGQHRRPRSTLTRMYTRDHRSLEFTPEIGAPAHGVARDRPRPRMTPEIGGVRTPLA